tara:strand:- start:409 stop:1011 length:603 start_codon:yes stop_codon:yes gene_type:complete
MINSIRKIGKKIVLDNRGFGLSETILSFLLLSFITTYALYFVSLRQSNLYKANLNNALNDEIRRDIEKLKSELWYQHFTSATTGRSASYSTEDSRNIKYCRDVLYTFYELPSWRNRVWTPGSNKSSYAGQKRNKIFLGANVRIERKISSRRPFQNIGSDASFDKSIAEITYNVTTNNKTTQWTSIQLSSEAHSWCPPYSR